MACWRTIECLELQLAIRVGLKKDLVMEWQNRQERFHASRGNCKRFPKSYFRCQLDNVVLKELRHLCLFPTLSYSVLALVSAFRVNVISQWSPPRMSPCSSASQQQYTLV